MSHDGEARDAVLIPTGHQMKSYGCMRSLNRHGLHTIVASELESIPHFSSRYCSEQVRLPCHWHDLFAYKDALLTIASRPEVKTIIPVRECDTYIFAKYRDEFADRVSLVSPALESLRRAHDRLQLATAAEQAGVPFAETKLLSNVDEWDRDVVIKSRFNILTGQYVDSYRPGEADEVKDVRFVRAGEEPDADAIRSAMQHEPIVQEFIPEAAKHLYCALWEDGEPVSTYQHRQIRKMSWVGGGGVYRESAYSAEVDAVAETLLSRLDWDGYACIEYVKDERTGEWKFLELNPRVWLSLPEAVRAGVDFPYHYWRCSQGQPDSIETTYETGNICHLSFGELNHLLSIRSDDSPFLDPPSFVGSLLGIVGSCIRHPRFDHIRLDDPRYFLSAVRALPRMADSGRYHEPSGAEDRPRDQVEMTP